MKKLFLLVSISILFLGCDDETQPSGGGQARIILNCSPATGIEVIQLQTPGGFLYMPGSTDLFTVTKGQSLVCHQTIGYHPSCKPIEIKFELNGTVVDTRNFNMGGYDNITCPDGMEKSCTFIVP
jgi:hypothetical protein